MHDTTLAFVITAVFDVLLNKLPPGVKLPPRPAQRSSQASDAAPATSDAISMLASVACM